jgi:hypothetical protein
MFFKEGEDDLWNSFGKMDLKQTVVQAVGEKDLTKTT